MPVTPIRGPGPHGRHATDSGGAPCSSHVSASPAGNRAATPRRPKARCRWKKSETKRRLAPTLHRYPSPKNWIIPKPHTRMSAVPLIMCDGTPWFTSTPPAGNEITLLRSRKAKNEAREQSHGLHTALRAKKCPVTDEPSHLSYGLGQAPLWATALSGSGRCPGSLRPQRTTGGQEHRPAVDCEAASQATALAWDHGDNAGPDVAAVGAEARPAKPRRLAKPTWNTRQYPDA